MGAGWVGSVRWDGSKSLGRYARVFFGSRWQLASSAISRRRARPRVAHRASVIGISSPRVKGSGVETEDAGALPDESFAVASACSMVRSSSLLVSLASIRSRALSITRQVVSRTRCQVRPIPRAGGKTHEFLQQRPGGVLDGVAGHGPTEILVADVLLVGLGLHTTYTRRRAARDRGSAARSACLRRLQQVDVEQALHALDGVHVDGGSFWWFIPLRTVPGTKQATLARSLR
jgi:hypothetical protein